jgi:hypothetical protein
LCGLCCPLPQVASRCLVPLAVLLLVLRVLRVLLVLLVL